jgi:hypothetical protein
MFERAKMRALPVVNQATEAAPVVATCCNACRACVTANLLALATAGAVALLVPARRLVRRLIVWPTRRVVGQ